MTTSSRNLRNQVNILKSLANLTNVPLVLSGNYDLITYRDLNGQTIRRGKEVHLRRYKANDKNDVKSFINVLLQFQKHLPLIEEPDLISHWDYFYSRTIGCIGILKDWFYVTYQVCTKNNPDIVTLNIDDFRNHEISSGRSMKLLSEATRGEQQYENSNDEKELYKQLGLIEEDGNQESEEETTKETESKRKGNRKPGERNPHRDKVGIEEMEQAQ